jgi:flagellar hook-associated protein 2
LRFNTPSGQKDVYIAYDDSTLMGVASAINAANIGVRAEVVQDHKDLGMKFRLLISGLSEEKGYEFPSIYLLDGQQDFYFDQTKKGQNAKIKVNGFEMEVPENKVKDLIIPGVTLDLKQAFPGKPINISIREDYEAIKGKAKDFVKAFNEALQFMQGQAKLTKDRSGRERLGPLGGDSLLRTVENTLRRMILNPQVGTGSKITRLNELGIEFNRSGTLDFNEEKFNRQIANQPLEVFKFMRGEEVGTGFISTVQRGVQSLTNSASGPLELRKRGINERIKQADQRIERKEAQLIKREESLRKKFSDLETKMSRLQTQGMAIAGGALVKPQGQGG